MVELTYLSLKKNYFLCSYFRHISLCFYSNSERKSSLDVEFDSASNDYPQCILLTDPTTPKKEIPEKMWWWHHHHIFQVFLFFGVAGSIKSIQVGTPWMWNQIPHPTSSPNRNLIKSTMRYVENTNTKSSFLLSQICHFNHYGWLILLKFYWFLNSNSQNLLLACFLIRPILDPKFPLMRGSSMYYSYIEQSFMYPWGI